MGVGAEGGLGWGGGTMTVRADAGDDIFLDPKSVLIRR